MAKPYSTDLRELVVAAVEKAGMSRRQAALHFDVGISTGISWARRFRETGSVLPGKMGGHKPRAICGEHRAFLLDRTKAFNPLLMIGLALPQQHVVSPPLQLIRRYE
jgi:putative transposase